MKPDLVSIIIPTFKRPSYLSRAILSALNQTYQNIEVLVIDDNDPVSIYRKETESLMFDFENNAKIKYIKHPKNLNGSAARNTGIKNSKGDFLAFLDDDDVFLPTKIEKQYNRLKHLNEDWGACYCFYSIYYNNKVQKYYDIEEEGDLTESILLMENPVASGSTLFIRKEVAVEFGGYNVSYQRHQDWEFLLRVLTKYKICQVKENLVNIYLESRINKLEPRFLVGTKLKFLNEFSNFFIIREPIIRIGKFVCRKRLHNGRYWVS